MAIQTIIMKQEFNAPIGDVFSTLSDHKTFGKICGIKMERVVDGDDGLNGLGSVRTINIGVLPAFEETITGFTPNERIEYKITKGSPLKNHVGELKFTSKGNTTALDYSIQLESVIPFTTSLIKYALESGISGGLKKYAISLGN